MPEYVARRDLAKFGFTRDSATNAMRAAISVALLRHLDQRTNFLLIARG